MMFVRVLPETGLVILRKFSSQNSIGTWRANHERFACESSCQRSTLYTTTLCMYIAGCVLPTKGFAHMCFCNRVFAHGYFAQCFAHQYFAYKVLCTLWLFRSPMSVAV